MTPACLGYSKAFCPEGSNGGLQVYAWRVRGWKAGRASKTAYVVTSTPIRRVLVGQCTPRYGSLVREEFRMKERGYERGRLDSFNLMSD